MNREAWLTAAAERIAAEIMGPAGYKVPAYRVACGFPSKGALSAKRRRVGECWDDSVTPDKACEILISPVLSDPVGADGNGVLPTLVHEIVHAVVGLKCGHRGPFKAAATVLGLAGKMTSTHAGPELAQRLNALVESLGPYPNPGITASAKAKVGSRLLLVSCACGIKGRMSQQAADACDWTCATCGEHVRVQGGTP